MKNNVGIIDEIKMPIKSQIIFFVDFRKLTLMIFYRLLKSEGDISSKGKISS
jgi:hypothetical protein